MEQKEASTSDRTNVAHAEPSGPQQALEWLHPESDGVDLSLIRWFLSLSPMERLLALQTHVEEIVAMRDGIFEI